MGTFPDCDVKLCDLEISRIIVAGQEVRELLGTPDYVCKGPFISVVCLAPFSARSLLLSFLSLSLSLALALFFDFFILFLHSCSVYSTVVHSYSCSSLLFLVLHSPFFILRSSFFVLVLHSLSSFFILHSSVPVLVLYPCSTFFILVLRSSVLFFFDSLHSCCFQSFLSFVAFPNLLILHSYCSFLFFVFFQRKFC